jgi:hypothetical protein
MTVGSPVCGATNGLCRRFAARNHAGMGGGVNLGMESDVHWRRTKLSCYRTLILLAFAAVALASLV